MENTRKLTRASEKDVLCVSLSTCDSEEENENDSLFTLFSGNESDSSKEEIKSKKRKVDTKSQNKLKVEKSIAKRTKNVRTFTPSAKRNARKKKCLDNDTDTKLNFKKVIKNKISIKKKNKSEKKLQSELKRLSPYACSVKIKSEVDTEVELKNDFTIENKNIKFENYIKHEIKPQNYGICSERMKNKKESTAWTPVIKNEFSMKKEIKGDNKSKEKIKNAMKQETEVVKNQDSLTRNGEKFSFDYKGSLSRKYKLGDPDWKSHILSEKANIELFVARNIINLLENDCTIPFIARYRRDKTLNMEPDRLRNVKNIYDDIKTLEKKATNVLKQIKKIGKLSPQLENSICRIHSLDELEFICAPFKQGSSKSKAEKARALGLEEAAFLILSGSKQLVIENYIDNAKDELKKYDGVVQNIQNILADFFSKDASILEYLRDIETQLTIVIKSNKMKKSASNEKGKKKSDVRNNSNEDTLGKFELYYDFQTTNRNIQSHQILALNRGEKLKILSVKMIVPDWLPQELYKFCENKWLNFGCSYALRTKIFASSFQDSYHRLIVPFVTRRIKSELNRKAHCAAIENFALNLKSLLQTSPIKGCSILGIDPGIRYGFKFALISSNGDVLWTHIYYFDTTTLHAEINKTYMATIKKNLITYNCDLLAIGNGTGCRLIENLINNFIRNNFFKPDLNLKYTIVNERGASVYSCTSLAKEEFPDLDPNLISAVFIARSLQDPLNEYVKVEPKHLGVGMYQHDLPEKKLNNTLNEIVGECVSFTGVDINTASIYLLKRISGLSTVRASSIIEWRRQNGPFKNREQLTLIKSIGPKTFEQCSGFIRIHPQTASLDKTSTGNKSKIQKLGINDEINPLDRTWIHPESYSTAYMFIDRCNVNVEELGTADFVNKIKNAVCSKANVNKMAEDLNQTVSVVNFIADALMKPNDYDYRSQFAKPLFKQGLTEITNLKFGMILTGVVGNVTNFGAFVDIGVGKNGLIHISQMNGFSVQVGDRVKVKIIKIEPQRERIGLFLIKLFK